MKIRPPHVHKGHLKIGVNTTKSKSRSRPRIRPPVSDTLWKNKVKEVMNFHQKELHFFDKSYSVSAKSWHGYLAMFPRLLPGDGLMTGEGTPNYLYVPRVPSTLAKFNAQTKVIFLLREPLQRAYSQYCHRMSLVYAKDQVRRKSLLRSDIGNKTNPVLPLEDSKKDIILKSFIQYITDERMVLLECATAHRNWQEVYNCILSKHAQKAKDAKKRSNIVDETYLAHSLYALQLEWWFQNYPIENILVLNSEQLYHSASQSMDEITKFLDLPPMQWDPITKVKYNVGVILPEKKTATSGKFLDLGVILGDEDVHIKCAKLPADVVKEFRDFFAPFNLKLEQLLKRKLWDYSKSPE